MKSIGFVLLAPLVVGCGHRLSQEEVVKSNEAFATSQEAVKQWIAAHAMYPESYSPISFDAYVTGRTMNGNAPVPNSETYELRHTHRLRSLSGDTTTYSGYFVLDHAFNVGIVETNRSAAIGAGSAPDWKDWTDLFGRAMTAEDTAAFQERAQKSFREEMERVRERMEDGDAYVVGAEGDSGKALVDSIIRVLPK
jgi:hypothetical protein